MNGERFLGASFRRGQQKSGRCGSSEEFRNFCAAEIGSDRGVGLPKLLSLTARTSWQRPPNCQPDVQLARVLRGAPRLISLSRIRRTQQLRDRESSRRSLVREKK